MRDPLLAPMAALGLGILLCRFVHFDARELAYLLAAFAALTLIAALCGTRRMTLLCAFTGIFFLGCATAERHRLGPPPQLNAENGESLTLSGCVIEPPAFTCPLWRTKRIANRLADAIKPGGASWPER